VAVHRVAAVVEVPMMAGQGFAVAQDVHKVMAVAHPAEIQGVRKMMAVVHPAEIPAALPKVKDVAILQATAAEGLLL